MAVSIYLSIITLNNKGLNDPIKRLSGKLDLKSTCNMLPTRDSLQGERQTTVRGWEKIFLAKGNDKKVGVAILISDKINFKTQAIKKDKEGQYITI